MSNHQYHSVRTPADVETFRKVSNDLHDGYITHVEYNNGGISICGNSVSFDYNSTSLILHVLVTSISGNPTFELVFRNIPEWQINEFHFYNMGGFNIVFLGDGMILWGNDCSSNVEDLKRDCYVISETLQYRRL